MKRWLLVCILCLVCLALPMLASAQEASYENGVLVCNDPAVENAIRATVYNDVGITYYEGDLGDYQLRELGYSPLVITADNLAEGQTSINLDALRYCTALYSLTIDAGVAVESFEPLSELPNLSIINYTGVGETVDLGFLASCNAQGSSNKGVRYQFFNCKNTNLQAALENKGAARGVIGFSNPSEQDLLTVLEGWPKKNLALGLDGCDMGDAVIQAIANKKITSLYLKRIPSFGDLTALNKTGVTYIRLTDINAFDLSMLSGWKKLSALVLDNCNVSGDFSSFTKSSIQSLVLLSTDTDLSTTAGLTKLSMLSLKNCNNVDLSVVATLKKLDELYIDSCGQMDYSPIAGLTNLSMLSLKNCNNVDLSVIASLKKLDELYIESCGQMDYSPIAGASKLKLLSILFPQQEAPDFSWLADATFLKSLQSLTLVQCGLMDDSISFIQSAKKLQLLNIANNSLTTTEALEGLKLTSLNLSGNSIVDYSFVNTSKLLEADETTAMECGGVPFLWPGYEQKSEYNQPKKLGGLLRPTLYDEVVEMANAPDVQFEPLGDVRVFRENGKVGLMQLDGTILQEATLERAYIEYGTVTLSDDGYFVYCFDEQAAAAEPAQSRSEYIVPNGDYTYNLIDDNKTVVAQGLGYVECLYDDGETRIFCEVLSNPRRLYDKNGQIIPNTERYSGLLWKEAKMLVIRPDEAASGTTDENAYYRLVTLTGEPVDMGDLRITYVCNTEDSPYLCCAVESKNGEEFVFLTPELENAFDRTFSHTTGFSEGLAGVIEQDESRGYIDTTGTVVLSLPNAGYPLYPFYEGYAMNANDWTSEYYLIDRKGKRVTAMGAWSLYKKDDGCIEGFISQGDATIIRCYLDMEGHILFAGPEDR